ncbi:MAG TPA: hypothetical protein VN083_08095, partial [Vicinamibacteria bacterium]|nr:hypothetical protein [Vicinamibacteria bacterium]
MKTLPGKDRTPGRLVWACYPVQKDRGWTLHPERQKLKGFALALLALTVATGNEDEDGSGNRNCNVQGCPDGHAARAPGFGPPLTARFAESGFPQVVFPWVIAWTATVHVPLPDP